MYNNKNTGISMGVTIIKTRDKRHFAIQSKNALKKAKRAKLCQQFEHNKEGFCIEYRCHCYLVNTSCYKATSKHKANNSLNKTSTC